MIDNFSSTRTIFYLSMDKNMPEFFVILKLIFHNIFNMNVEKSLIG